MRKLEIFWNKISSTGCKRSSLDAPGTETHVSHQLLDESLFLFFLSLGYGVIRNGSFSIKMRKLEVFWNQISSTGCKWSSLDAPGTDSPVSHPFLGESLFLISSLWGNKKRELQYKDEEAQKNLEPNKLNRLQVVQFECPRY